MLLEHLHPIELPTPFPVGPITVYLAGAPGEPLTLIDTGPRGADTRAALEAGLADLGYSASDLDRIVVTHAHVDHFGLAADLAAVSGAEVWTHPWNVPTLADYDADRDRRRAFYGALLQQAGMPTERLEVVSLVTEGMKQFARRVPIATTVDDGDRVRLAGRDWQVLHTPGHASGLVCLYEAESRTLLSSDHLLADISSNPVIEPPPPGEGERPRSLALYRDSLLRVAALAIDQALPSHGPVIYDVAGLVDQRLAFHRRRLERVREALRNGAQTTWEITHALFLEQTALDTFLAVSEVIGHLDLLEIEGEIRAEESEGISRWRLVRPGDPAPPTDRG